MRTQKVPLRISSWAIYAFGVSGVMVWLGALYFRSTIPGINQSFLVYFFTLTFAALLVDATGGFWRRLLVLAVHLVVCVGVGFAFSSIDQFLTGRRATPHHELVQSLRWNSSTINVYRNDATPILLNPSIEIEQRRTILPYVLVLRTVDSFTRANGAEGTIDASGVMRLRVISADKRAPARETVYQLKPWVWF
jgi:hypothetical protein